MFATRVLYVVAFGLASVSAVQPDLWWLLRAGKEIWTRGRVSLVEHYSHTANGRYWPNQEWLWEAVAFAIHQVGGLPLLTAWVGITVVATLWVVRRLSRATGYVVPLVLTVGLPLMSISWTIRPQVASMLFFAITMLLLERERYRWIPPLFLVWANMHAQVVMGGVLLGSALAFAVAEHLWRRRPESAARAKQLAVVTAVSAAATLATPLGPRLWSYVLGANSRPGQAQITEWASAFALLRSSVGTWATLAFTFWLVLVLAVVLSVVRRDRTATWEARVPLIASAAMAPLAVLAVRNIPFFLVAVMPLLMTLLEFRTRQRIGTVVHWRTGLGAFGVTTAALVALVWISAPPGLGWRPVPAGLAQALRACPGPLYNEYDAGAAIIWWVPDVKVFVDNRQDPYPAKVIRASFVLSPARYRQTFDAFDIECALLPAGQATVKALRADGWETTYDDRKSVVLVAPRATSDSE